MKGAIKLKPSKTTEYQIEVLDSIYSYEATSFSAVNKFEEQDTQNTNNKYLIIINTDFNEPFKELINSSKKNNIIEDYNKNILYKNNTISLEKLMEAYKNNEEKLLQEPTVIVFETDTKTAIEYIRKNPEFKNKQIVIESSLLENINIEELKGIEKDYPNISYKIEENSEIVPINEYIQTKSIIDNIVNYINQFNFSPMEQIMCAYDIVKERIYQKENKNEQQFVSRDLTSSLLGNKIVCVGYSEIFNIILKKLNIKTEIVSLENKYDKKAAGHARNVAYVKDDKYGIDGVYYFDTTGDRKRKKIDNDYFNNYKYFAQTQKQISEKARHLTEINNKAILDAIRNGTIEDSIDEIIDTIDSIILLYSIFQETKCFEKAMKLIREISNLSKMTPIDVQKLSILAVFPLRLIDSNDLKKEIVRIIEELVTYYKKPIPTETLIEVLYNVRKQQYYNQPEKYPFTIEDFRIAATKAGWSFQEDESLESYSETNDLEKNISSIRLVRTLKNIGQNKR